jgi:copper chaperone CopZ
MTCVHCKARVEKGLSNLEGVTSVIVDLDKKIALVEGEVGEEVIEKKVNELGYDYIGTLS